MGKKKKKDEKHEDDEIVTLHLSSHAKRSIAAILLFVIAVLFVLGFFHSAGVAGEKMTGIVGKIFGWGKYIAPLVFIFAGAILLRKKVDTRFYVTKIVGISLAFWGTLGLFHLLPFEQEQFMIMAQEGVGGGYLGYILANLFATFTGKIAGTIILLALILVGFVVAFNMSLVGMGAKKQESTKAEGLFSRKKKEIDEEIKESDEDIIEDEEDLEEEKEDEQFEGEQFDDAKESDEVYKIPDVVAPVAVSTTEDKVQGILDKKNEDEKKMTQPVNTEWELPPLKLLERGSDKAQGGDVKQQAERIRETFENFGITMELEDIVTGPTVTQYSFRPQSGVKLSRITALNADLALSLAAHPIRIEAPIPGKSLVGIEVPNKSTALVRLRSLFNTDEFDNTDQKLLLALGEDVNGDHVFGNLAEMPHLLVAGTTGAGKSVAINNILLSLLYKNSPDDLKLILVDPKRVELSLYQGIPHLLSDVIVDNGKVVNALKWTVSEMERRYKLLQEMGVRDLQSYNKKRETGEMHTFIDQDTGKSVTQAMENLPVIVIVIDELSDLMGSHGKEVEGAIVRISQMSRAIGIHLVISTQKPIAEVVTGLIKSNLPTRIALKVGSSIDSRTILDATGAEKLIGNGDMLYKGPDTSVPIRLQNPFVGEKEIGKVINFIKRQAESVGAYDIDEEFDDGEDDHSNNGNSSNGIKNVDFSDENGGGTTSAQSEDPIYEEAKELVIEAGKASTSYIQRRLRVGYSRAARLMDELEDNGVIGPPEGSKPRKILIAKESDDMQEIDEA
ncbi:MAG: DNA translocase FtsK 4TM domain-containing protein [Patescibacteria group bacterium]|nr:DNA translocase FtsK 4TM domain-containing protein [Patescibacteria group bacterium]